MTIGLISTPSSPDDALVTAERQVAEARERRDRQVHAMSDLGEGTDARIYAEHVLRVMEESLVRSRMHQAFLLFLVEADYIDGSAG